MILCRAHAKVNLALAVAPPRLEDGLHPIASWIASIALVDDLTIWRLEPDRDSRYAIFWADSAVKRSDIDWSITKDLAVRAHMALERETGQRLPVQLKLEKRIPVGAGLGGGSSDAAATLLAVRDLFDLSIDDHHLCEIGLTLGADVPFFLPPQPGAAAFVSGVGECIERAGAKAQSQLIVVIPACACSTGAVYRAFDDIARERSFEEASETIRALTHAGHVAPARLYNDLAAPAQRVAPSLQGAIQEVSAVAGCEAHLTGSGSAIFLCAQADDDVERLAQALQRSDRLEDCAIFTTTIVSDGALDQTA